MQMSKTIKILFVILGMGYVSVSCQNWLDIEPGNAVTEDKLFSSKEGFLQALNGVYLDLNDEALYGATLLCRDIEILSHSYQISYNNADYTDLAGYQYKREYPKKIFQATWDKAYTLILTVNRILAQAEQKKTILGDQYEILKGELYALRAMLHFDMLRLFGPVIVLEPTQKSIPYNTSGEIATNELLGADEVLRRVVADLVQAELALQEDPIITQGPELDEHGELFFKYRTLRLNYYAVKALQARVYLYSEGINSAYRNKAFEAATLVIRENEVKGWFPFVVPTEIQGSTPDRIFSTEVLFMNQNNRRVEIFKSYFDPAVSNDNILAPSSEFLSALYAETDYRYRPIWLTSNEKSFRCCYKYASVPNGRSNDLVPLFRLSEMYLIAAETAPDPKEGLSRYLNPLIFSRYGRTVTAGDDLEEAIQAEYRREFLGEGQLFFYYKRKNRTLLPSGDMVMKPEYYVIPLPDSEMMYR